MGPYENLANAILLQAVNDHLAARRRLKRKATDYRAQADADSIERFFRSKWYQCLTEVDGERLIKKLRQEDEA